MKNTIFKPVVAFFAILAVLSAVGCDRTANNANIARDQNAAPQATNSNTALDSTLTNSACNGSDINTKLTKVREAVAKEIAKDSGLQSEIDSGLLKYSIELGPQKPPTSLDMYLEGAVGGGDNFVNLIKIIRGFVKSSCTGRVIFVKLGTIKPSPSPSALPLTGDEFQWFVCEDPLVPCPGGTCKMQCFMDATAAPKSGTDLTSNSNANAKSNVNVKGPNKNN